MGILILEIVVIPYECSEDLLGYYELLVDYPYYKCRSFHLMELMVSLLK